MLVVRTNPQLATDPEKQGEDEATDRVLPGITENLPVTKIVAYEADLGEDEGQIYSIEEL
jgi:hypothetical protein